MHNNKISKDSKDSDKKASPNFRFKFLAFSWILTTFGVIGFFIQLWLSFRISDVKSLIDTQFLFEINSRETFLSMCLFSGLLGLGWLGLNYLTRTKKIQSMFLIIPLGFLIFIVSLIGAPLISSGISDSANIKQTSSITERGLKHCTTVSIFSKRHLGGRGGQYPSDRVVRVYQKDCSKIILDFKKDPYQRAVVIPLSNNKIKVDHEKLGLPLYSLCSSQQASWIDEFKEISRYDWELLETAEFRVNCEVQAEKN